MRLTESERHRVADTIFRRINNPHESHRTARRHLLRGRKLSTRREKTRSAKTGNFEKQIEKLKAKANKSTTKQKSRYARRIRRLERTMRRSQISKADSEMADVTKKLRRLDGQLESSSSPKTEAAALAQLAKLQEQFAALSARRASRGVTKLAELKRIAVEAVEAASQLAANLAPAAVQSLAANPTAAAVVVAGTQAAAVEAMQQSIQQEAILLHAAAPLAPPPHMLPPPDVVAALAAARTQAEMAARAPIVQDPYLQAQIEQVHAQHAIRKQREADQARTQMELAANKAAAVAGFGAVKALPGQYLKNITSGWGTYLNPLYNAVNRLNFGDESESERSKDKSDDSFYSA